MDVGLCERRERGGEAGDGLEGCGGLEGAVEEEGVGDGWGWWVVMVVGVVVVVMIGAA